MFAKKTHPRYDLSSKAHMADPIRTYDQMRSIGAVVPVRVPFFGDCWMANSHESCVELLKDSVRFSRQPERAGLHPTAHFTWWMPRSLKRLANNLLTVDDPDHKRMRSTVDHAFARRDIAGLQTDIETLSNNLLSALPLGQPVEIISKFTRQLPLYIICDLLGLTGKEREDVAGWSMRLTTMTGLVSLFQAIPGLTRMQTFLRRKIGEVRVSPEPGLISLLANAEVENGLSDEEIVSMILMLFIAGHETTVHLINGGIISLLDNPDQKATLLADWDHLPLFTEEVLRHFSPVQMTKPRFVTQDLELGGTHLPKGSKVFAYLGAANLDPAKYLSPDRFDMTRKPNPHLSFSTGIHFCLGLMLARLEMQVAIQQLFTRFPNLSLATPRNQLDWRPRLGMRALNSLKLNLG